jgi:hypothetical protein
MIRGERGLRARIEGRAAEWGITVAAAILLVCGCLPMVGR